MLCLKLPKQNRFRNDVFPTPESPTKMIFTNSSQLSSVFIYYQLQIIYKISKMPKLQGKQVKDYLFGQCLLEFQEGSEIAKALKSSKHNLVVYGIPNSLVDPQTFPHYNNQVAENKEKIYPVYLENVRSQNYLYMIFEDLKIPGINSNSIEEIKKILEEEKKLFIGSQYKFSLQQVFMKNNGSLQLCIIIPYSKNLQKSNNLYMKFHNKSILSELFCKLVPVRDKKKCSQIFIESFDSANIFERLLPYLDIKQAEKKQQRNYLPVKKTIAKSIQPLPSKMNNNYKLSSESESQKSNANKIKKIKELQEEYPEVDENQFQQLMKYVHVNPSLKQQAGLAYRISIKEKQFGANQEITEIVDHVNSSLIKIAQHKSKQGQSKVEIKLNKGGQDISQFQVHFEAHYSIFKLFKLTVKSFFQKYKNGFAGIIAAYLLTLIGILRRLKIYTDFVNGEDVYEIGGFVENMDLQKYTNHIKKELARQARGLVNLKNIIENANMPYQTYEALIPFLCQNLQQISLQQTQNFCFFYMSVLMRMKPAKSFHEILCLQVMYILISPFYSIVYSEEQMPSKWDEAYFELKKLLISTLVPKWQI